MKRFSLTIIILIILASCHTPGKYPLPLQHQAMDEMESFRNLFLEGRLCDAEMSLNHAVDIYAKIDDMCAISDAYIQQYLFNAYINNERKDYLDKAEEFADIGNCNSEKQKVGDLRSVAENDDEQPEIEKATNQIYLSVILRKAALVTGDRTYIDKALNIDRSYGWRLFVIHDLIILKSLSVDEEEKDKLQKRIEFLSAYVQQCY
ncbi:MAG: hypothetical protein V3V59_07650 [Thermodesulfovibrionales bacterium]